MMVLPEPKDRWDPRWSCLLVVDAQNDFISPKGSAAHSGLDVAAVLDMAPRLVRFIAAARRTALPIIYIKTLHGEWTDSPSWVRRMPEEKVLSTCREGSWGAEFYDGIVPRADERVVVKHRYSAFIETDLNTVLRARGIESVIITGVTTNVCVETTARDAYGYDHYVTLVEDCVAAYDPRLHDATLTNMRRHFGLVASAEEIVEAWRTQQKKAAGL
jgi:ureidoacrylate peracid hydrolase